MNSQVVVENVQSEDEEEEMNSQVVVESVQPKEGFVKKELNLFENNVNMINNIKRDLNNRKVVYKNPYKETRKKEDRLNRLRNITIKKKSLNKYLN